MRGTSSEENFQAKEDYESLLVTHGNRVYTYRSDSRIFSEYLFKETIHTCGKHISYCGVVYNHQNTIVEHRIKELTLGGRTPPCAQPDYGQRLWAPCCGLYHLRQHVRGTTYQIWKSMVRCRRKGSRAWSSKYPQWTTTSEVVLYYSYMKPYREG